VAKSWEAKEKKLQSKNARKNISQANGKRGSSKS